MTRTSFFPVKPSVLIFFLKQSYHPSLQVLIAEKAMAKAGVAPTMLAKALQLQKALAEQGVAPELISEAISELLQEAELPDINFQDLLKGGISPEDVNKIIALSRSFKSGDNKIKLPDLNSKDAIKNALKQACENDLKKFAKTVMAQKAMAVSGATPEQVAKVAYLTKSMAENGMSVNEIANALTMALTLPDGASPGKPSLLKLAQTVLQSIQTELFC